MSEYYADKSVGQDELDVAQASEDKDALFQNIEREREKEKQRSYEEQNPYIALDKKEKEIRLNTEQQIALLNEDIRRQKEQNAINLHHSNLKNNLDATIANSRDIASEFARTGNISSITDEEKLALFAKGKLDVSPLTGILNQKKINDAWSDKALDNQLAFNKQSDIIKSNYQSALNKIGIREEFQLRKLDDIKKDIDLMYSMGDEQSKILADGLQALSTFGMEDINADTKPYTTSRIQGAIQPFIEMFDELLGGGANIVTLWNAGDVKPIRAITDFFGITQEGVDWQDGYSNKYAVGWDTYYKNPSRLLDLAINGLGSTAGIIATNVGIGKVLSLAGKGSSFAKSYMNTMQKFDKAIEEAKKAGNTFNLKTAIAGKGLLTALGNSYAIGSAVTYPLRTTSRAVGIASDRAELQGREYSPDELQASDFGYGGLSALMDTASVPAAFLGGKAVQKLISNAATKPTLGSVIKAATVAPILHTGQLAVTEGATEVISTISEIAGTYGIDFSDILQAYASDDPKDNWIKEAVRTSFVAGIAGGMPVSTTGALVQGYTDYKNNIEKNKEISSQITKGTGAYAREHQYETKIQSFNTRIDEGINNGSISKEDGKILKDSYHSIQRTSQENKSLLDQQYKGLTTKLNKAKKDNNQQEISSLQAQMKTSQKVYSTIDTMNSQLDKLFDKAIKNNNTSNLKIAMDEFQKQLHSNNVKLGETGLNLNKSFFGEESTTLFSNMRDIFEKNNIATKQEFNYMIKQSMKETKDYKKNLNNKEQEKTDNNIETEVSNQKSKEQESEAKSNFIKTMDKNNVSKNTLQQSIDKNKQQEIKSREEQVVENNKKDQTKKDTNDESVISSINDKLIDASADEKIENKSIKDKLLDSAVYSNNKTLSQQLSHFIKEFKSINKNSNKNDVKREFKDKLNIELTDEEANKIYQTIKDNALYLEQLSYEKEIIIKDEEGNITQVNKENVFLADVIVKHNQAMKEIEDGIEELHQKILDNDSTDELKQALKDKIDDMNINLLDSISLASTAQLSAENKAIVKSYLIQITDRANNLINQYAKYSNMLEEKVVQSTLPALSDDNFIQVVKKIINRFAISLKRLINNFENFVKQSKDIKKDIKKLSTDIKEVIEPMNKVLSTIAIIQNFKKSEDFIAYNNTVVKEEFGLGFTNKAVDNLLRWDALLEKQFDFSDKAIRESLNKIAALFISKYRSSKPSESYQSIIPLSIIFGNRTADVLKNVRGRTYEEIDQALKSQQFFDNKPELLLKSLTMAMIKIVSTERQGAKLFSIDGYKIIDNVQIEASLKDEFKEMTGIDLSNNPKMVSFLFTFVDTFMRDNQKVLNNYNSFTSSESSFNTASVLSKIIDDIDIQKVLSKNKAGETYLERKKLTNIVLNLVKNKNQQEFLRKQQTYMESKKNTKTKYTDLDYALENYARTKDIFELSERLQRIFYKGNTNPRTRLKEFIAMKTDSPLSAITEYMQISREENQNAIYDILYEEIESNNPTIAKANRKRYILNQSKLEVFKQQFGEEALNLEEVQGLTENGYKLLVDYYKENPAKEFDRDNPLFYVPVQQYNKDGSNAGVKYYKLPDNPKLIQALSLEGVLKSFRTTNSVINSDTLNENFVSKISDVMKNIGNLYSLFKYGNKPFFMNYNLQESSRLYMPNSTFNLITNKLLREFTTLDKNDYTQDNDTDYKGKEKISEEHRTLIRNILLLATIDSSYDKTPFKVNNENALQWIITDKDGEDITEYALKDIDNITDMIINGQIQQAINKIDQLISRQGEEFDFTDDGNTTLTNLLVLKNSIAEGYIVPNDMTVELDGLSTGISETTQHMNSSESTAMMTSTQKFFVVDNKIYSGYLEKANEAKSFMNEEPTFENIIDALQYDIYGSVITKLYNSLKGLNTNTGNLYLDTLSQIFNQSLRNPNKVYKQLRELGKKLVLGPNYGQNFTSMIYSDSKDSIKSFIIEEGLKNFNSTISDIIQRLGIENQSIRNTIERITSLDNVPQYIKTVLTNYLNSLSQETANADFSENTIAEYVLNAFNQPAQNDVLYFLGNNFDIGLLSDSRKETITQDKLLEIERMYNDVLEYKRKLEYKVNNGKNFSDRDEFIEAIYDKNSKDKETVEELKKLYNKNKPLFLSIADYLFSETYQESDGNNGFVVKSLNSFKETAYIRSRANNIKNKIIENTLKQIKLLTFKPIIDKYKEQLNQVLKQTNNQKIIDNEELSEQIPFLSFIPEAQEEILKACELTYQRINDFVGSKYDDYSKIHMTFKKEKAEEGDKRSFSEKVSKKIDESNKTEISINVRPNGEIYSSSMENINILENYVSFVINLIEHDIEASIMNSIALDDNLGASFSIFDGVFVRPDRITQTAEKWNKMLGESRLVNKDYSILASILRLENLSREFLNSLKDPNEIVTNILKNNELFKKAIGYIGNETIKPIFASSIANDLFKYDKDNQLLNHSMLNDVIIIEKYTGSQSRGGFYVSLPFDDHYFIVVTKGTLEEAQNGDQEAIERIMHELYHLSSWNTFKDSNRNEITSALTEELETKYADFKRMLQRSDNEQYQQLYTELDEIEEGYVEYTNTPWIKEIISNVFAYPTVLFNEIKGLRYTEEFKDLLSVSQQVAQYGNYYTNEKVDGELEFNGNLFDFTSKNTPINMRVIDVNVQNSTNVKNENGFDYSINQMTFKELKNSPLINFLSKSRYTGIDQKILPLAVSKIFSIYNPDVIAEINDDDIMLGRNLIIDMNGKHTKSFLDDVFEKIIDENNGYTLLDAYNEIRSKMNQDEIHFIPKTILSQKNIDMIRETGKRNLFDDFLSVINSALYNQGMILENDFNSNQFSNKNQDNRDIETYTFGQLTKRQETIKKSLQYNAKDEVVNNVQTTDKKDNNNDDDIPWMYRKELRDKSNKDFFFNKQVQSLLSDHNTRQLKKDEAFSFLGSIFRTNKVRDEHSKPLFDIVQEMIQKSISNGNTQIYFTSRYIDNGVIIDNGKIIVNKDIAKNKISDEVIKDSFKTIIDTIINKSHSNSDSLGRIQTLMQGFYKTISTITNKKDTNIPTIQRISKAQTTSINDEYNTIIDGIKEANSTIADKLMELRDIALSTNSDNTAVNNYEISENGKNVLYTLRSYLNNNMTFLDEEQLDNVKSFLNSIETRLKLYNISDFVSESLVNPDIYKYIKSKDYSNDTIVSILFNAFNDAYQREYASMDAKQPFKSILNELAYTPVSYQLRANQQAAKSMRNVEEFINLNNSNNEQVNNADAREVIDNYYDSLNSKQKELLSPIVSEIKKSLGDTTIIISDLLNDSAGISFVHNGKKYIVLSKQNVEQNTLAHELGHTIIDSALRNEESISIKNIASDIRYLQSYIMEELRQDPQLMESLGLMNDGKTNAVFDEVFSKPNEFIMYFLFDKEKLDILSNFSVQDLNTRNYQQPKSILGRVFKVISQLIKKVTELLSLKNTDKNARLDKYLSDNFMKLATLNDPDVAKALDNTFYNKLQMRMNDIVTGLFSKVPLLQSMQNVDKWLKENNYTEEQVEQIINDIKAEYNEKGFLSTIVNYDYKGVFKPFVLLKLLNILNPMYYKSPLHRKIALQMLNRSLNASNNFIAKELGRVLRDFGIISVDNQSEIENLLGQKLSLDQMKAKTNQFISETYQDARSKILGDNATRLDEDELKWEKPTETDYYGFNEFSPKQMFERSIGSIIGEIQIGKGFNDTDFLSTSKVGLKAVIDNMFDDSTNSLNTLDRMINVVYKEMEEVVDKITKGQLPKKEKEKNLRTFMRKLEILAYTRLTNQVSDSSIENQAEIVRQSTPEFKENIKDNLSVKRDGLINKMEQLTTLYAIRHIKTLNKDKDIVKYQKQIEFAKQYIDFADGKMNDDSFIGLSITSSLHSSLIKESQQYESLSLSKNDMDMINTIREENARLLTIGEITDEVRDIINKNNDMIEEIIEQSIRLKEDFEQDDYTKDYSRDGYTKYAYNKDIADLVSIQYVNPEVYEKEQIRQYYNEIAENNKIDNYRDVIEYKLNLGYDILDEDGNIVKDRKKIDDMINSQKTITMRYESKFSYSSKYTPYAFIGVKNKTSGSLLSDNMSMTDNEKQVISDEAEKRFQAEQHIISSSDDYNFDTIRKNIKRNFMEYRYSTNADVQLRTKQSKFMIEKMSKLDNSMEQQLLGLENSIFQKKNADRFNAKLALAVIDDNKIIHSSPSELKNAEENYIKIIDLTNDDFANKDLMLGGNVYAILLKTLFRYNQDKPASEQIKQLYISQDNAEYLLGIKADKLSVKATRNISNATVRKFLNRIESIFDIFWNDVKETVLIRNPKVLYMNIMSNFSSLTQLGLSIPQIAERSQAIEKELEMWENDLRAYSEAQNTLSILLNNRKAKKEQIDKYTIEINNLENRLLNSRVFYPMMNGVDSNIVDETVVNVNEIDNVLRNGLEKLLSKTDLKGKVSQSIINNLILSQSSDVYKKAMKFNRFGDIIPRVIAYEVFKTKENLDNQSAMNKAQDMFVNYNIPLTSKFLMFLDKIGMQQFIRFNVKVQRAAAINFMQYPVSTLSTILGANFLQSTLPFGEALIVDPLSNENAINKNYNMFGMLSRNLTPFYRWNGFTDILNAR